MLHLLYGWFYKNMKITNLPVPTLESTNTDINFHSMQGSASGITAGGEPLLANSDTALPPVKRAINDSSTTGVNRADDTVRHHPKNTDDTAHECLTVSLPERDIRHSLSPDGCTDRAAGKKREQQCLTPTATSEHRTPEAVGYNEPDNCPGQRNVWSYPGIFGQGFVFMDNSPSGNYCAKYANIPDTVKPKTIRIGNQQLITLDTSQPFVDSLQVLNPAPLVWYKFSFLADFLLKNNKIEYIVDIGCGHGAISLLLQKYLNEKGFQIKVVPVDIRSDFARDPNRPRKPLPLNIIPAQEIAGADPATTLFVSMHPFTGGPTQFSSLMREIAEGESEFYITTVIKNNPGCFVLTTEDPYLSSPQDLIPPELTYAKHYWVLPDISTRGELVWEAEAAEINAENSDIHQLNQFLANLPAKRASYLGWISSEENLMRRQKLSGSYEEFPDDSFSYWLNDNLRSEGLRGLDSIRSGLEKDKLVMYGWHVYRQDVDVS